MAEMMFEILAMGKNLDIFWLGGEGESMLYSYKTGFLEGKAERVEDGYLNQIMNMVSKFVHFFPQGECFIR